MTRKRVDELSPAAQKGILIGALLRAAVSATLLVVVYYLAPLDRPLDAGTWIEFAVGLVVFAVIIGYHARAIAASDVPHLRMIQAVATGLPTLLLPVCRDLCPDRERRPGQLQRDVPSDRCALLHHHRFRHRRLR